ncbi:hypothetical protein GALMADRAFT_217223 [Galerina marginata CBS 339.88]|uniref:Uncharacterized protein n=1 Tax=Galerina marginata (strain CBS 339.88) TaxID=685588 RepID=A0A067S5E0_GALM3|nr:hypothetical protein GALMADRAFT_217223 [Galerina marginata CBS 339.88]
MFTSRYLHWFYQDNVRIFLKVKSLLLRTGFPIDDKTIGLLLTWEFEVGHVKVWTRDPTHRIYRIVSTVASETRPNISPVTAFLLPQVNSYAKVEILAALVSLVSHASAECIPSSALDAGTPKNSCQHVRKRILNHRLWRYRNESAFTSLAPRNISPGITLLFPQVLVSLLSHASTEYIRLSGWDVETPRNKHSHCSMALSIRVHAQVTNLSDRFPRDVLPPPPRSKCPKTDPQPSSLALSKRVFPQAISPPERFSRNDLPPPPGSRIVNIACINRMDSFERSGCRNTKELRSKCPKIGPHSRYQPSGTFPREWSSSSPKFSYRYYRMHQPNAFV